MPAWKVLVIGVFACVCLALAFATVLVSLPQEGGRKWLWIGGLLVATLGAGALFALFLRYAGGSLDEKPRGARN